MAEWYDIESARAAWPGAPMDDDVLQTLLDASQEAVLAYAPALTATAPDPGTLTDGAWTANLSGSMDQVTATVTLGTLAAGSAVELALPIQFRPAGIPSFIAAGGQAQGFFQSGDTETFRHAADPP